MSSTLESRSMSSSGAAKKNYKTCVKSLKVWVRLKKVNKQNSMQSSSQRISALDRSTKYKVRSRTAITSSNVWKTIRTAGSQSLKSGLRSNFSIRFKDWSQIWVSNDARAKAGQPRSTRRSRRRNTAWRNWLSKVLTLKNSRTWKKTTIRSSLG